MSRVVVNEQAIMPMMFREPSLGTPQELLERVLRMPIFQGIEGFATEMIGEHHLCFWEMGYPEVRSGIAFAYCAKHGLESAENFGRCVELFARAQAGVSYLFQKPCPFRASSWDPTPLRTLQLQAISVITRGYQIYGRPDRLSSFRDNKRSREVCAAVIVERELVEVAPNYSRSSQQTPSPAPRLARSSSYLLRAFLDNIDEVQNCDSEVSDATGATEQASAIATLYDICKEHTASYDKGNGQAAGSPASSQSRLTLRQFDSFQSGLRLAEKWHAWRPDTLSSINWRRMLLHDGSPSASEPTMYHEIV